MGIIYSAGLFGSVLLKNLPIAVVFSSLRGVKWDFGISGVLCTHFIVQGRLENKTFSRIQR